jgi:hypothetical protein
MQPSFFIYVKLIYILRHATRMIRTQLKAEFVAFRPVVPLITTYDVIKGIWCIRNVSDKIQPMCSEYDLSYYYLSISNSTCLWIHPGTLRNRFLMYCGKLGSNKRWMSWKVNESWRSSWMGVYLVAHDLFYRKLTRKWDIKSLLPIHSSSVIHYILLHMILLHIQ